MAQWKRSKGTKEEKSTRKRKEVNVQRKTSQSTKEARADIIVENRKKASQEKEMSTV